MNSPKDMILRSRLAQMLGLSIETLKRWERQGKLPPSRRVGPRLKGWRLDEVRHLIAAVSDNAR